ncbi:MAG: sodium/proline symporter [Saccharofermentans sp.]|nr:sodium/proline symporter [Saccharofermentans sp.]
MSVINMIMMGTIIVYLAAVIIVGFRYSKSSSTSEFYLGGRKLGPFVTAMSAEASDMSSWLLLGLPGLAYASGLCDPFWTAVGLAAGTYLNWLLVSNRLRVYSQEINEFTIPGFFSGRYNDKAGILKLVSALVIVIFFIPYTGSGFAACGKLFSTLFGIDYHIAMILSAIVILAYTTLGGFLAASTTDFIQSIIMTAALITVLGYGTYQAGGVGAVAENAKGLAGFLSVTATHDGAANVTGTAAGYGVLTTISTLSWGLGYFGMPHILLRFMAIEDRKKLKLSRRIASVWVVIAMAAAILIGMIANAMTDNGTLEFLPDGETAIINIAKHIASNGWLLAIVGGIILAGIMASTMSTADSQLLAASSSVSEDIFKGVFRIKLSEKKALLIARVVLLVIGVIGVIIAWDPDSSVFKVVSFAWAGFGAAFAPAMLFSLFWKRTTKWGVFAGMLAGGTMVFVWEYLIGPISPYLSKIYELFPAFVFACLFIVVISLVTPAPEKEIQDTFDKVRNITKS